MERLSWSELWFNVAKEVSKRSLCDGAKVGTAIVDKNNRIVSTGYNGPPHGFDHKGEGCLNWCERQQTRGEERSSRYGLSCPSVHSEANALMFSDRRDYEGGSIYVTAVCCEDCSKMVANSGVKRVYMEVNESDLQRPIYKPVQFLLECGIEVTLRMSWSIFIGDNDEIEKVLEIPDENTNLRLQIV